MTSNHERFEELIPIYALEALDGEELREVKEHLKTGCRVCEELLREQERIKSFLPYSVMAPSPSPRVKDRLFKKIKSYQEVREKPDVTSFWERLHPAWLRLGGAVALALLVLMLLFNLSLRDRLRSQQLEISKLQEQVTNQDENMQALKTSLAIREAELIGLKEEIAGYRPVIEFLQDPQVIVLNLDGLEPSLTARGRVLWDREHNQAFFHGVNLPPTPSEKTYQLWAIVDSTPKSLGVFKVDEKGSNLMKLESLPDSASIKAFAVTLEPDGGVPLPTGKMYLLGKS